MHRLSKRRLGNPGLIALAALLLLAALALSACGSGNSTESTTSSSAEPSTASEGNTSAATSSPLASPEGKPIGTCTIDECDIYKKVDWSAVEGKKFGFIVPAPNTGVFRFVKPAKQCVEEHGVEVVEVNLNGDFSKTPSALSGVLAQGVSAIFEVGIELKGYKSFVEEAKKKGIPIIGYAAAALPGTVNLETNAFRSGMRTAEYMVKKFPEGGTVVSLGTRISPGLAAQANGMMYVFEQHPEFNYVEEQGHEYTAQEAEKLTTAFLEANPETDGVIGVFGEYTAGATNAIERAGSEAIVAGVGGDPEQFDAMRKPNSPFKMVIADGEEAAARLGCETAAVMLAGGQPAGTNLVIGSTEITTANIPEGETNEEPIKIRKISPEEEAE